ncbi:hypothetical protein ACFPRL_06340 [Pseudoclavibacter helvolus]
MSTPIESAGSAIATSTLPALVEELSERSALVGRPCWPPQSGHRREISSSPARSSGMPRPQAARRRRAARPASVRRRSSSLRRALAAARSSSLAHWVATSSTSSTPAASTAIIGG